MRKIFAVAVVACAAVAVSGCESVKAIVGAYGGEAGLSLLDKAADGADKVEGATLGNAMKALPKYCDLPPAARKLFRDRANARAEAEGATLGVHCPGDPPLTLGGAG